MLASLEPSKRLPIKALLLFLFILTGIQSSAQDWLRGYNFRKKITVKKAMVAGMVNLTDFQLLVSLEDSDLRYVAGACAGNKISGIKGRDFAFTLVITPVIPLNYQLDQYEPETGKLVSWVKLASLSASGTTTASTELYLYYGSNNIHFPDDADAQATWSGTVSRVWHMNENVSGRFSGNAKSKITAERLVGSSNLTASNYTPGKISGAVSLNGVNQSLSSGKVSGANFYVSCWIKFSVTNREQIILSNDSTSSGGHVFKINAQGKLVQEMRFNNTITTRTAAPVLVPNRWYFLSTMRNQNRRGFYIDGVAYDHWVSPLEVKEGGTVVVGRSKQQDKYLHGTIDELKIQSVDPTADWVKTAYNNQLDPSAFYVVSAEESRLPLIATGTVFNGLVSELWSDPGNWNTMEVPGNSEQIILKAGKTMELSGRPELIVAKLTLEPNATLQVRQNLEVLCQTELLPESKINIHDGSFIQIDGDVLNHGSIETTSSAGGIRFSSSNNLQFVSGSGHITVNSIENNQATSSNIVKLEQRVDVTSFLKPVMGILNANGFLTLKYNGPSSQASVWPISDINLTSIAGEVTVEQYVPGAFPMPATARGWRLFSAPVYHGADNTAAYYHLYDYKGAAFITGPGGQANGFDSSPQNGHTIYTHNQLTQGTLSQKYIGIPVMSTAVNSGRGIYVFSRGDRNTADAYGRQIQTAPFENPAGYLIRHKGLLFQGNLEVALQNRNMGEAGDGFNLLGNPYAASLRWGDLGGSQTAPYIWQFNALNNAYDVSDDPNTIIAAGEGFFVKVRNGSTAGSMQFREQAKYLNDAAMVVAGKMAGLKDLDRNTQKAAKISLTLSRDVFKHVYHLVLDPSGNNEVDDQDASSIGSGYVSISGIASGGTKLSFDERTLPGRRPLEVPLYVKGWATGRYQIRINGLSSLPAGSTALLSDTYLHIRKPLKEGQVHDFELNTDIADSFGEHRFVLIIQAEQASPTYPDIAVAKAGAAMVVYPNPFSSEVKVKLPPGAAFGMGIRIRDLMGRLILSRNIGLVSHDEPVMINAGELPSGPYLLELLNLDTNQSIKTSKIIKR